MYMLFVYVNKKVYNPMGIRRDSLAELYDELERITLKIWKENPRAEVTSKVSQYI